MESKRFHAQWFLIASKVTFFAFDGNSIEKTRKGSACGKMNPLNSNFQQERPPPYVAVARPAILPCATVLIKVLNFVPIF